MNLEPNSASCNLQPGDVAAELLALSVIEHTYTPDMTISIKLDGVRGLVADTGRGMRLTADAGDTISHAERALTSIYPIVPARLDVEEVLVDLVRGERGCLGPALANAACRNLEFTSRRDGAAWAQRYRRGIPVEPAVMVGPVNTTGTTIRFETEGPIDRHVIQKLVELLRARIPGLRVAGPDD